MSENNNYVDNKKMYDVLVEYLEAVKSAKSLNLPAPPIPEYLGECFLLIATKLSHRFNFSAYTWREEMISDSLENVIMYLHNFDPSKSKNAFGYFGKIIWWAFVRRINKEKSQLYIKYKMAEQSTIHDTLYSHDSNEEHFIPAYIDLENDSMTKLVREFEENLSAKKKKRFDKKNGIT